jgi:hypothetical protein
VTFDDDVRAFIPTSAKHLDLVLHTLDRVEPGGEGELTRPLTKVAESVRRRSILLLISDLYAEPDTVVRQIAMLTNKGHDVIVFHVLDTAELTFPFDQASQFEDIETGDRIPVVPESQRAEYLELMERHLSDIGSRLVQNRVDYYLIDTSKPLDFALFEYLSRREALARVR